MNTNKAFDQYLHQYPTTIQGRLTKVYTIFQKFFPEAQFIFSYQMPTFKGKKNLVHFAAYTNHIGIYPGPLAIQALLETYPTIKTSKGTWLIAHDQPLPLQILAHLCRLIQTQA